MKKLIGAAILGQSGGPTSVINASAAGVFIEALKHNECITQVYGAKHGIRGILNEEFYDINAEDIKELNLLKTTPSSEIGSVRYKLKPLEQDDSEYQRLLEVFKKYNIRYFFYNGGNDSMDTCNKVSKFFKDSGYECRCIGVPKTIDNDLCVTDHCPGYASAARYVATTLMELSKDANVYDTPMITVVEIMGRNAGWLTAAASLASYKGAGPDLIYLPEEVFDMDLFFKEVEQVLAKRNGKCLICISEGVKDKNGKYIPEIFQELEKDSFGHSQLGGSATILANELKKKFGTKVRGIEFSLMQRSAQHLDSKVDVTEAFTAGAKAVKAAVSGKTDYMVGFERKYDDNGNYKCNYILIPLELVANGEKKVPLEWIKKDHTGMTDDYIKYALPLIQGDCKAPLEDGLPRFAKLKKILVDKK